MIIHFVNDNDKIPLILGIIEKNRKNRLFLLCKDIYSAKILHKRLLFNNINSSIIPISAKSVNNTSLLLIITNNWEKIVQNEDKMVFTDLLFESETDNYRFLEKLHRKYDDNCIYLIPEELISILGNTENDFKFLCWSDRESIPDRSAGMRFVISEEYRR